MHQTIIRRTAFGFASSLFSRPGFVILVLLFDFFSTSFGSLVPFPLQLPLCFALISISVSV
jgi:hypothetical protein